MIVFWQAIVDNLKNFLILNPPETQILEKVPHCKGYNCTSIGFFILGEETEWITPIMTQVALKNNLQFDTDVKLLLRTNSPSAISTYLSEHLN